jgi:two-component system sensor histidine kinase TctE
VRCGIHANARAYLQVEDNGPGIAPPQYPRVLEPFYRAPGVAGEGSGLGLAIAQEIALVHGSQLELAPAAQGRGLRVTVEITE